MILIVSVGWCAAAVRAGGFSRRGLHDRRARRGHPAALERRRSSGLLQPLPRVPAQWLCSIVSSLHWYVKELMWKWTLQNYSASANLHLVSNLLTSLFPKLPEWLGQDIPRCLCAHPAGCVEDQSQNYWHCGNTLHFQGPALQVSTATTVCPVILLHLHDG